MPGRDPLTRQQPPNRLIANPTLQWIAVFASIVAATVARWLLDPILGDRQFYVTYFVAIYFIAWYTGLGLSLVALFAAWWTADYFFITPRYTWWPHISSAADYVGTAMFFLIGGTSIVICEAMRRAQRAAAEQTERLRTTVDSIGDAVIATDVDGRVTSLNPVAESLTGWTIEEALGQPLESVFHIVNERTRQAVENPATRALREGIIVGLANHTILIAKDGTERPIDDSAAAIRCKDGEIVGCVLVFRDVTERRTAENALRASESRKSAILQSALDCIITIDHQGKIIEFNPAAERTFGYRRVEVLGKEMAELIVPPSLRERHYRGLENYLATGHGPVLGQRIEMPALRADGTEFAVELAITAIRRQDAPPIFTAYLRDITERQRAERRRAARMAVTQILAEAATVGEAAPRILQAICENLGWDVGAMWRVVPQTDVLRCVELWHQPTVQLGEFEAISRQFSFRVGVGLPGRIWASGQPAWIPDVTKDSNFPRASIADNERLHAAFGFPLMIGAEFRGVIEFFSHQIREPDVDLLEMMTTIGNQVANFIERKQADEALRQVAADLSEADRRKNEFLAMLAHELRNPLAPIRNALQIMRLTGGDEQTLESASAMMERQIGQMVRLVDDLLDVSRISRGKIELRREPIELASVVHHAIEAARPMVNSSGQELSVTMPPEPIYLYADATRLSQVIGNLLNNAFKFTAKGGRISLIVGQDGQEAVIRVKDTGIGIAAEQLPRIFDMFAQVDTTLERSESGLGIGLTLVKNLVDMHGGTVEAVSGGIGQGSEFIVRLPIASGELCAASDMPANSTSSNSRHSPLATKRRILVVDDNQDSAKSLATLLTLLGHQTHAVHDGLEAVEMAESFRPDVVLLDIGLPKLNGYEAARRIREQPWGKRMVLVALTGWGQDDDRRKSHEAGFDAHFVKPVDPAALTKLLAESPALPA